MGIRRVVTGHDANGKAVFTSDKEVEPITLALLPGAEFFQLWGADAPRRFPDDGSAQAGHRYYPPVGGFRFGLFTVAPDSGSMLEDLDLGTLHGPLDGCHDAGSLEEGRPDPDRIVCDQEDLWQLDLLPHLARHPLDVDHVARLDPELLSTCADHGIHGERMIATPSGYEVCDPLADRSCRGEAR